MFKTPKTYKTRKAPWMSQATFTNMLYSKTEQSILFIYQFYLFHEHVFRHLDIHKEMFLT